MNRAVVRGAPQRRLRANRVGMRLLLPTALRHGLVLADGYERILGCLLATPPLGHPLPAPPPARQLLAFLQGPRVRLRWSRVFEHLEALHPSTPHWYLATLGVVPEARGRGRGRALLASLLARVDAEHAPCYLETDRPENVPFYQAAGFSVLRESEVFGVPVWHLWRAARSDESAPAPNMP